jgi:hypothetical protein
MKENPEEIRDEKFAFAFEPGKCSEAERIKVSVVRTTGVELHGVNCALKTWGKPALAKRSSKEGVSWLGVGSPGAVLASEVLKTASVDWGEKLKIAKPPKMRAWKKFFSIENILFFVCFWKGFFKYVNETNPSS